METEVKIVSGKVMLKTPAVQATEKELTRDGLFAYMQSVERNSETFRKMYESAKARFDGLSQDANATMKAAFKKNMDDLKAKFDSLKEKLEEINGVIETKNW